MKIQSEAFRVYINAWQADTLDAAGQKQLYALLEEPQYREWLDDYMREQQESRSAETYNFPASHQRISAGLQRRIRSGARLVFFKRLLAAAVVVALIAVGAWWWQTEFNHPPLPLTAAANILPGGARATLTLSNGRIITLDNKYHQSINEEGATFIDIQNGKVTYNTNDNAKSDLSAVMNTLTTPRGGQYQLALPDGSLVWLNAASSISYPARFIGKERLVTLSGEAYFEVVADATKPFRVSVNKTQNVEVLGTSFNINAYPDEQGVTTTLIEGSVRLSLPVANGKTTTAILTPGQQARQEQSIFHIIDRTDIEAVLAWKNGEFRFNNQRIDGVLRQVARWYDIEVSFNGKVPEMYIGGDLPRSMPLSKILEALTMSGVHHRFEGRQLVIEP